MEGHAGVHGWGGSRGGLVLLKRASGEEGEWKALGCMNSVEEMVSRSAWSE